MLKLDDLKEIKRGIGIIVAVHGLKIGNWKKEIR
jgi:hypothetical protein